MRNAVLWFCLALSACASVPSQDPQQVRSIIQRHNSNAERWYASGEIDSVASLFAEDAWQMPPNSPPLVGREAIRQFWRQAVKWGSGNSLYRLKMSASAGLLRLSVANICSSSWLGLARRPAWPHSRTGAIIWFIGGGNGMANGELSVTPR